MAIYKDKVTLYEVPENSLLYSPSQPRLSDG